MHSVPERQELFRARMIMTRAEAACALMGAGAMFLLMMFLPVGNARAASPFLDMMYGFSKTPDMVYGSGNLGYPVTTSTISLLLDVYQPTGANLPAKLPALIAIHGGGFINNDKTEQSAVEFCQKYASRGYVTASINYRLMGDNPSAEPGPYANLNNIYYRTMSAAAQDAAKAVRWLRANAAAYHVDPDRIAIQGASAGAVTSLLEGYQESGTIGASAHVGAVVDLWGGMYGAESLVDADDPPAFIVHGTADATVSIQQSYDLVNRCGAIGLACEFHPIQDAGHGCWPAFWNNVVDGKKIDRRCAEFLFRHLNLLPLHPVASTRFSSFSVDAGSHAVSLEFDPDENFVYQIESSDDLKIWSKNGMPAPVSGVGDAVSMLLPIENPVRKFFRINIQSAF
jgi:acetyl esterase/lipase